MSIAPYRAVGLVPAVRGVHERSEIATNLDHLDYALTIAIDLPGPETDRIAAWARRFGVYVMAQAKARHTDFPDRSFNVGFGIDRDGAIMLKHYKLTPLYPIEHSVRPHDVFDRWVELISVRWGRSSLWSILRSAVSAS